MKFERFERIKNYPKYCISNLGNIKTFAQSPKGKLMTFSKWGNSYLRVNLTNDKIQKSFGVAELVLTVFDRPRPPGMQVRHLDGNPENNCINNLAWGTSKENRLDAVKHENERKESRRIHNLKIANRFKLLQIS